MGDVGVFDPDFVLAPVSGGPLVACRAAECATFMRVCTVREGRLCDQHVLHPGAAFRHE